MGFPIQRGARADVVGDVGDGHVKHMAAVVLAAVVGFREDRIVVVLGVRRVDGDERDLAPVLALAQRLHGLCCFGFLFHRCRKDMADAVAVQGDLGDRLFRFHGAEAFHDAGARRAVASGAGDLYAHQIAVLGALQVGRVDVQFALLAVHRFQIGRMGAGAGAHDPEDRVLALFQDLDDPACVIGLSLIGLGQANESPIADARLRTLAAPREHQNFRCGAGIVVPVDGLAQKLAIPVAGDQANHEDGRQVAGPEQAFLASFQEAFVAQLAQHALKLDAGRADDAEMARDLALARLAGIIGDEGEDILA